MDQLTAASDSCLAAFGDVSSVLRKNSHAGHQCCKAMMREIRGFWEATATADQRCFQAPQLQQTEAYASAITQGLAPMLLLVHNRLGASTARQEAQRKQPKSVVFAAGSSAMQHLGDAASAVSVVSCKPFAYVATLQRSLVHRMDGAWPTDPYVLFSTVLRCLADVLPALAAAGSRITTLLEQQQQHDQLSSGGVASMAAAAELGSCIVAIFAAAAQMWRPDEIITDSEFKPVFPTMLALAVAVQQAAAAVRAEAASDSNNAAAAAATRGAVKRFLLFAKLCHAEVDEAVRQQLIRIKSSRSSAEAGQGSTSHDLPPVLVEFLQSPDVLLVLATDLAVKTLLLHKQRGTAAPAAAAGSSHTGGVQQGRSMLSSQEQMLAAVGVTSAKALSVDQVAPKSKKTLAGWHYNAASYVGQAVINMMQQSGGHVPGIPLDIVMQPGAAAAAAAVSGLRRSSSSDEQPAAQPCVQMNAALRKLLPWLSPVLIEIVAVHAQPSGGGAYNWRAVSDMLHTVHGCLLLQHELLPGGGSAGSNSARARLPAVAAEALLLPWLELLGPAVQEQLLPAEGATATAGTRISKPLYLYLTLLLKLIMAGEWCMM
jgi:hypothetical protein